MSVTEPNITTEETGVDQAGNEVYLNRHDEYREALYDVSYVSRCGRVYTLLYFTRHEAEAFFRSCVEGGAG